MEDWMKQNKDLNNFQERQDNENNANGQCEINLPYKIDDPAMPNTKLMVVHRLKCTENKIMQNGLDEQYCTKIQKYVEKGYAEKIDDEATIRERTKLWYFPHFPVLNPNKPEKLRIVFDAATKINGFTLNDFLLTGLNLLKNFNATKDEFPKAAAAIVDQHYVDDYMGCADSVKEAVEVISDVIEIQSRGGFEIRGFMTNSYDVVKQIPAKLVSGEDYMLLNKNETVRRVLGLQWQCKTDC
jgi:hypothetical protein